jgi:phosphatidylserine/phosphatidylglycerophosphate/cardiolipin synthase-like enzyme/uncharacterized membrane protein YdjX (TVP38/TMEM64 family)
MRRASRQTKDRNLAAPDWLRHTEWVTHADRVAPLVDGVEYFRALRAALLRARRQVLIVGWDIHSEIDLLRGDEATRAQDDDGRPVRLADVLERIAEDHPDLHVSLLIWEGSPLFAFERQSVPRMKRPWGGHDRISLVWDRDTPPFGSQHQKLVVIDDRVAFVGGMDLTHSRWDTHEHEPDDARRTNPGLLAADGRPYHDIMMAIDGEAAGVVGDWCRERWRRAAGVALEPPGPQGADAPDPWPPELEAPLVDRRIAIALTQPEREGRGEGEGPGKGEREEKRQIEALYLAQIASARKTLFIENQYFSSEVVCDALCERLREPDGPEVVMILPYGCPGALQSMALDTARDALVDRLREADHEGRLGVYWPTLRGGDDEAVHDHAVYVHAKTMVVDDALLRIGSANLAGRSMGLDGELDACVWVEDDEPDAEATRDAITHYRRRLLAYLLHVPIAEVARAEERTGSVRAAIEALREGQRTLHPFEHRADTFPGIGLPLDLADPDRPLDPADVVRATEIIESAKGVGEKLARARHAAIGALRRHKGELAAAAGLAVIAAGLALSPLRDEIDAARVRAAIESIRSTPVGAAGVVVGFWVAATLGIPVTLLIVTVAAVFGAASAVAISLLGVAGSGSLGFFIGRRLPRGGGEGRLGRRLRPIAKRLRHRGVLAIAVLRNVPIAPFALVNVACGLSPLGFGAFLVGTVLGMGPGIVVASVFGQALGDWISDPTLGGVLRIAGAALLVVAVAVGMDRWLDRKRGSERSAERG